jgi:predicted DNA-binding transcriptional regulator AlpA
VLATPPGRLQPAPGASDLITSNTLERSLGDYQGLGSLRLKQQLMGTSEIAEFLGVTNQRVDQLARRPGFPEPVAVLAAGRIWSRSHIEAWARRTGRQPR